MSIKRAGVEGGEEEYRLPFSQNWEKGTGDEGGLLSS
jgi:hypothetical protein